MYVSLVAAPCCCTGSPRAIKPGLRPGPRRQARRVGRGSGVNGAPQTRPRAARTRSTAEAGGAHPDNARRSGLVPVTLRTAIGTPGASMAGRDQPAPCAPGTLRREPTAAGAGAAVRGSGCARMAAARKGASEAAAPQRRDPVDPGRSRPVPAALLTPPGCSRLCCWLGPGRQAWRAGAARRARNGIALTPRADCAHQ